MPNSRRQIIDNYDLLLKVRNAYYGLGFQKPLKKQYLKCIINAIPQAYNKCEKKSIIIPKRISFLPISEMSRLLCSYKRKTMMAAIGNKTHYILRQYVFFTLRDREHWWYKSWTRCGTGSRLNCKTKAVQAIYWAILTSNNSCP